MWRRTGRFNSWRRPGVCSSPDQRTPVTFGYLVEIFPGEERLVAGVRLQQGGEGAGLLALLPGRAAAVALQGVVGDAVVVRVLPRQDAGSAGAAQRTGHKLTGQQQQQQQRRLTEALLLLV